MFARIQHVHFVGIGGIGMSGLAEILLDQGFTVSGSDMQLSETTEYLSSIGAKVYAGHSAKNIEQAEVVVYSSAVKPTENPETVEASRRGIPLIRRAEMLAEVTRMKYSVGVTGTHGKTTTTSMIGLMLLDSDIDPTVIVGGKLTALKGTNARLGKGDWTVVEADEYDRSFLQLTPSIAVITNLEEDHLDIYRDIDDIKQAFVEFANKVPFYGVVIMCLDDVGVMEILPEINKKKVTYGMSYQSDIRAENVEFTGFDSAFTVVAHGKTLGRIQLPVPGEHNVRNALAAVATGLELEVDFSTIASSLAKFTGVYRRFERKGEKNGVLLYDDYAHHPTEVKATLQAARNGAIGRVICVFQPHTYTRTKDFAAEFGKSFQNCDVLVVTDVYPAREEPIEGVTGELIAEAAKKYGHRHVEYVADKNSLPSFLDDVTREGDLVLTVGAGDVWRYGEQFLSIVPPSA